MKKQVKLLNCGDKVKRGDVIGLMGTTGYSSGIHLHFEVQINFVAVDPMPYFNSSSSNDKPVDRDPPRHPDTEELY